MSGNSPTIQHPPTLSHTSHIWFPHHTSQYFQPIPPIPHLCAQTQVLDTRRKTPTAQNVSPGTGALHKPSTTSSSSSVFRMPTHRSRQRSDSHLPRHFPQLQPRAICRAQEAGPRVPGGRPCGAVGDGPEGSRAVPQLQAGLGITHLRRGQVLLTFHSRDFFFFP